MEVWSFFSGAMGLDIGLSLSGLKSTLAVELDKNCCDTIKSNVKDVLLIEKSVSELRGDILRDKRGGFSDEVFLMVGGPPCQSFSTGGKRAGISDPRGNLTYEYIRLISEIRPRYFIFENVANIVTAALKHRPISQRPGNNWNLSYYNEKKNINDNGVSYLEEEEMSGSAISLILKDYNDIGYNINFGILDAADYGAAQHRLRFVMMGARDEFAAPSLPDAMYGPDRVHPFRTVRDVISDLETNPGPHSVYTPEVERYFLSVPEGKNWRSMPLSMQREAMGLSFDAGGGKTGFFRRLSWDAPAPTITGAANRKASALCHPSQTRPLSVKECARIQGFPDDWKITGSMAAQYRQIGNAVPVALGAAIGSAVIAASDRTQKNDDKSCLHSQLIAAQSRLKSSARNKIAKRKKNQLYLDMA